MTQPTSQAIIAARLMMAKYKIPASVQLGQWALESGWGQHVSAPYNFWGMKSLPGQPCAMVATKEVYKGQEVTVQCAFRSFASIADSFDAHAKLLATGSAYADFRSRLPDVYAAIQQLGGGTPQRPRYATDPAYGAKLGAVIKGSTLTQYDRGVV